MRRYPPPPPPPPQRLQPVTRSKPPGRGRRSLLTVVVLVVFGALAVSAMGAFMLSVGVVLDYTRDLEDPTQLEEIVFSADTVIYARDGKTVLARFSQAGEQRRVIDWDDVPPILADATTAVEDKTFWANTGIDPIGLVSAAIDTFSGDPRGGSTITQQLVRQRLLPDEVMQDPDRLGERKIQELIQSVRVTDAYRGEEGKQDILTAYLNQNFYGNNSYGVRAAARSYFGKANLFDLTLSEAATLAAIPQAPSTYDLVRNAIETEDGDLEVPADSAIVRRRNLVLDLLARDPTRRELSGNQYSTQDFLDAKSEPLELDVKNLGAWKAPHFVWYVRDELRQMLCGEAETCRQLEEGGLRVTTTLDWKIQKKAEKWVEAGTLLPHRANPAKAAANLGVRYLPWMRNLVDQNVWNGALSALDYETGEIIAYVGSANYYERRKVNKRMQPQFDVLSSGWRQPGSAFKPFNYATGIDDRTLTASTMLMDVTTDFGGGYTPTDFTSRERGPVKVREALQFSLNVPAVKALGLVGERAVFDRAEEFGMDFQRNRPTAGLAMALGSLEVHPIDLNQSYATVANGGRNIGRTSILTIVDRENEEIHRHKAPRGRKVISPQAAWLVTDILAGNTDPTVNPVWAQHRITSGGRARPAALKTGTSNDAKDLNAYGFIAPPTQRGRRDGEYALTVGVWAGNSNSSPVTTVSDPVFSLDVAAPIWDAFLTDVTRSWRINDFSRPGGLRSAQVDVFTGYRPSEFSQKQTSEWFIEGTEPRRESYLVAREVVRGPDREWYRWERGCDGRRRTRGYLVLDEAESQRGRWNAANQGWVKRARRGPGVAGRVDPEKPTFTSYFEPYGQSWGGAFAPTRSCKRAPKASASPSAEPSPSLTPVPSESPGSPPTEDPGPDPTDPPLETPKPTKEPTPKPTKEPTPVPTKEPTPDPTEKPTPDPTEEPTPKPTKEPTPDPTEEPTPKPTKEPTPEPTSEPAAEPTPEPTKELAAEPTA